MGIENEFLGKTLGDKMSDEQKTREQRALAGEYMGLAEDFIRTILPKKGEDFMNLPLQREGQNQRAYVGDLMNSLNVARAHLNEMDCEILFERSRAEIEKILQDVEDAITDMGGYDEPV